MGIERRRTMSNGIARRAFYLMSLSIIASEGCVPSAYQPQYYQGPISYDPGYSVISQAPLSAYSTCPPNTISRYSMPIGSYCVEGPISISDAPCPCPSGVDSIPLRSAPKASEPLLKVPDSDSEAPKNLEPLFPEKTLGSGEASAKSGWRTAPSNSTDSE